MRSLDVRFVLGVVVILLPREIAAQQLGVFVEPSIEITNVHDDNLFLTSGNQAGDTILRIRPALALRFASPRWSASGSYGFDSERYAANPILDNTRVRERAWIDIHYQPLPRLTLALDATYTDTHTPSELNVETGLAATRVRAQRRSFRPSARFRISPRLSARGSTFSTVEKLTGGGAMRAQFQMVGIEQRVTPRDVFAADVEHGHYLFDLTNAARTTSTVVLRAGWTRDLGTRTRLSAQAGPRITNGSMATELSASLTHAWRLSSIALSCLQTQTTVIGSLDTVETRNVQARFAYTPTRSITAYAAPAILRSANPHLEATVYRMALGARYAITPLVSLEANYSRDSQRGAIDPSRAHDAFSHRMLSLSLTSNWRPVR